jgi:acetyl-CoA C-acetyltransferase
MASSYLIGGCRTPLGKFQGALSTLTAPQLGAVTLAELLRRTETDPGEIDEVILGLVLAAGVGQAPARQAALGAGLPDTIAALTINKVCGSGLKAVMLADQIIRAGDAQRIVAGGMESMSQAPYLLQGARTGWKFGNQQVIDAMLHDGLWCPFENQSMGVSADYIARQHAVSRAEQDAFAAESHRLAHAAAECMAEEIVPVRVPGRKGETIVSTDEGPRPDTTEEVLAKLRPAFSAEGTVTAGNSSQISDGAAALLVVNEEIAHGVQSPLKARIVASATSGVAPKDIFIAPVSAMQQVLAKAKMAASDIDLIELNEAFAAQCVACIRPLKFEPERVNARGGAIALGHPIGASGARVLVTLLHALAAQNKTTGLVSLCLGGGNAVAMIVERIG